MAYTRAHLNELGLVLWRSRDRVADESAAAQESASALPSAGAELAAEAASTAEPDPGALAATRSGASPGKASRGPVVSAAPVAEPDVAAQPADPVRLARIASLDWAALQAEVEAQARPPASRAVFGVGARDAEIFVVGEAPGADEDRLGEPFVGRAGQLLDQMLRALDLSRARNVYIANICKFRPPNNRDPLPQEVAQDLPYLHRQIELVAPRAILAVGRIAAQNLLDTDQPIGRLRGQVHGFGPGGLPVVVTYHPAYLLRSPREKAKSWQDLKRLRDVLRS